VRRERAANRKEIRIVFAALAFDAANIVAAKHQIRTKAVAYNLRWIREVIDQLCWNRLLERASLACEKGNQPENGEAAEHIITRNT